LDLRLDVLLGLDELQLALDVDQDAPEALLHTAGLEECLTLLCGDVDVAGHEVREPPRVIYALEHLLDDLLRQPHLEPQIGRPLTYLTVESDKRCILQVEGW
jgi:hypothetical protein